MASEALKRVSIASMGEDAAALASVKRLNETWHNAEYGKPAPHLRETIEAVRMIIAQAATGEPIRFEGHLLRHRHQGLGASPSSAAQVDPDLLRGCRGGNGTDGR